MAFEEFHLAASTADLAEEPAAREHADLLEYRLDLAAGGVDRLADYDGQLPLLVTNRTEQEGGEAAAEPERLDALCRAAESSSVAAVDIELDAVRHGNGERVLRAAREHDVAVIVSTHDFESTPDRERLDSLLSAACERGDVGKLAVTAADSGDVLDLLVATRAATVAGNTVATMAMGEVGRHSRVVAPLYGSRLGYAPVAPDKATAAGQFDLETFRRLHDQLRGQS